MAKKTRKPKPVKKPEKAPTLTTGTNPLADVDDGLEQHRPSEDLIYESIMRGGGEPFGTPYEIGISSLTDKLVKFFKQRSFWRFETYEPARTKRRRNRFTRYGSSRFHGTYDLKSVHKAIKRKAEIERKQKKK